MKKGLSLLVICALLMQLCGCGALESMKNDGKAIDEMSEEIIRCLVEKDRDSLEKLFCQQVRSSEAFDSQLDELYEFFDHDHFIRYDLDGSNGESKSQENGECVRWFVRAEIVYIEVVDGNTNRFYGIKYTWAPICEEDEDLVGLHTLSVNLLNTDNSVMVGTEKDFPF